jgi:signal transduction histidine kinase
VTDDERPTSAEIAPALALLAHDLRNPASAILANLNFLEGVADVLPPDERDALADAVVATRELITGIEHLGWLSRSLRGEPIVVMADADVVQAVRTFASKAGGVRVEAPDGPLRGRNASGLVRVLELFAVNTSQHAPGSTPVVRVTRDGDRAAVTFVDDGPPIADALRPRAFDATGQMSLKGRADGRYARMLGLAAIGVLVRAMGATVTAGADGNRAAFTVALDVV